MTPKIGCRSWIRNEICTRNSTAMVALPSSAAAGARGERRYATAAAAARTTTVPNS
jgi:hypothetical protein